MNQLLHNEHELEDSRRLNVYDNALLFTCLHTMNDAASGPGRMDKPSAPLIGRTTHHSVELSWEAALEKANETQQQQLLQGDARFRIQLEQREATGPWETAYTYV